ncbi:uncharacterized protein LOC125498615 [Beta vulgaris subsp. vulgaris]|uniref:uncharacterized protein LOC125498615 n=1 Tax=Beta vulgaris subsp. vulgaris TaxID=3555 RepID=UPI002036B482|nr:uncharacterized protein LOC125498615 [Beta vulgaris subsp. vulgaris]
MKRKERSWMYNRLDGRSLRTEFVNGIDEFIEFCLQRPHLNDDDKIKCSCIRCNNLRYLDADTVKAHLYSKGFKLNCFDWLCHGERATGSSSSSAQSNPYMFMVVDALGNTEDHDMLALSNSVEEEPNGKTKKFFDLLKVAKNPLYEGSKVSVLEMASRVTSLKCEYNLPHRCVDGFASLLNEAIPQNNHMGRTFYDIKKVLKGLELPHERIHVCPRGCMLFWKGNAHLDKFSVCGNDRYKKTSKGKLIPAKVLIYFPITSKLQRLFEIKNISLEMTWHADNPQVQGTLAHPSDSEACKHFNRTFPDFAVEAQNVRLGLCTDGFSPYGTDELSILTPPAPPQNLPSASSSKGKEQDTPDDANWGQTSDTLSARKDMARVCKRRELELVDDGVGNLAKSKAPYTLDEDHKSTQLC